MRKALRAVAIAACLPYIGLKAAWIAGSHLGIPEGSELREPGERTAMIAINAVSVVMDAAVVVLALLLTRPWGRRVPAWLLALPVWCACGLLAPEPLARARRIGSIAAAAIAVATGAVVIGAALGFVLL